MAILATPYCHARATNINAKLAVTVSFPPLSAQAILMFVHCLVEGICPKLCKFICKVPLTRKVPFRTVVCVDFRTFDKRVVLDKVSQLRFNS